LSIALRAFTSAWAKRLCCVIGSVMVVSLVKTVLDSPKRLYALLGSVSY
jgi:hypothetical protein